jgi:hypothetical protein
MQEKKTKIFFYRAIPGIVNVFSPRLFFGVLLEIGFRDDLDPEPLSLFWKSVVESCASRTFFTQFGSCGYIFALASGQIIDAEGPNSTARSAEFLTLYARSLVD